MSLKDTSGNLQTLTTLLKQNDFTVISFYDPTCEHCKIQMPELDIAIKSVINQTGLAVSIYAICNSTNFLEKEWKNFINENKLTQNFTHVILGNDDKPRIDYAAYSNPIFFLTDKNGTLLLKKATVDSIKKYLLSQKKNRTN